MTSRTIVLNGRKASLRLRGEGKHPVWHLRFTFNGQHVERSTRCTKLTPAMRAATIIHSRLTRQYADASRLAITDILDRWLEAGVGRGKKSEATAKKDRRVCRLIAVWLADRGIEDLAGISRNVGEDYKTAMLKSFSAKTAQNRLSIFKSAMRWAAREGIIESNPLENVELIPARQIAGSRRFVRAYSDDELERILEAAEPSPYRDAIYIAAFTGIRRGEIVAANVSDIEKVKGKMFLKVEDGKSAKPREVPIADRIVPIIRRLTKARKRHAPLVPAPDSGARINPDRLSAAARRVVIDAGIGDIGKPLHTLRHTVATKLLQSGVPDRVVMQILGHNDFKTLTRYAHLTRRDVATAMDKL